VPADVPVILLLDSDRVILLDAALRQPIDQVRAEGLGSASAGLITLFFKDAQESRDLIAAI
jgi:hypothetical protein